MSNLALANAHIGAQARLRQHTSALVGNIWGNLGQYDEQDVPRFLQAAVPVVTAAQRRSAALTNAFLARSAGRLPLPLDYSRVTGPAIRNGATPQDVYRRPFVTVWTSLSKGTSWAAAVAAGQARATSTAAMDVQNTMRHTLTDIGERDDAILGYVRVPDGAACTFCTLVAGNFYSTGDLMPVHNNCGCGVDPVFSKFSGPSPDTVTSDGVTATVEDHGELGPLLVDGADHFTHL